MIKNLALATGLFLSPVTAIAEEDCSVKMEEVVREAGIMLRSGRVDDLCRLVNFALTDVGVCLSDQQRGTLEAIRGCYCPQKEPLLNS